MKMIKTLTKRTLFFLPFLILVNGQPAENSWKEKVTVRVDGLACPFCAYGLEKKLERLNGVEDLIIKINEGVVILYSDEKGKIDEKLIRQKVKEAGFTPRVVERETMELSGARSNGDDVKTIHLSIDGMKCEFCVLNIETALKNIEGVDEVIVNLENNSAEVLVKKGIVRADTLIEVIEGLGKFKARVKK